MADLPTVNAIEEGFSTQNNVIKDSISRLQSSIRTGLAMNRSEIKSSTSSIIAVQQTLAEAFNVNRDLIDIEKEKMRIAEENRREDEREQNKKQKNDTGFIAKAKGGLFDVLKKVFFGGALVGAAMLVVQNWETITETFEKIKPFLITFKDKVVEFGEFIIPKIVDNFDLILKGMLGAFVLFKGVIPLLGLLKKGITSLTTGISTAVTAMSNAYKAVFGRNGLITKTRIFMKNVKNNVIAMGTAALNLGKAAIEWTKSKASQLVKLTRAVVLATSVYATTTLAPALASLKAGLVAAAPFVAIAAGIALAVASLTNAFGDAKDKFEETGSVTEALKEGLKSLFANIIGLPIKLIQSVGRMVGLLGDPEEQAKTELEEARKAEKKTQFDLKMNRAKLQKAKAQGDKESIKALQEERNALNQRRRDELSNIEDKKQALEDSSNQQGPVDKIKGFLDSLDPESFIKNLLRSVLPDPTGESIIQRAINSVIPDSLYEYAGLNPQTGEPVKTQELPEEVEGKKPVTEAVQPVDEFTGAEVDTRSREVASQPQQNVQISAPQQQTVNNNSQKTNNTTVAPTSARRGRMPLPAGYQDPILGP